MRAPRSLSAVALVLVAAGARAVGAFSPPTDACIAQAEAARQACLAVSAAPPTCQTKYDAALPKCFAKKTGASCAASCVSQRVKCTTKATDKRCAKTCLATLTAAVRKCGSAATCRATALDAYQSCVTTCGPGAASCADAVATCLAPCANLGVTTTTTTTSTLPRKATTTTTLASHADDASVTIVAPTNSSRVPPGADVALVASALDPRDGDVSPAVRWTSSVDGPLGSGASLGRTLTPGTHTITATVTGSNGFAVNARVVVIVDAAGAVGYRDFTYPSAVGTGAGNEATAQKPESHLWFLDHIWWAVLYDSSAKAQEIHRLDTATQRWIATGVLVDERPLSRQDCLWNGEKLYMASRNGYGAPGTNRLLRFSYDPDAKTYSLDAGFPVEIPGGGTESETIAEDSTGRFWVAYTLNGQVYVATSLADDAHWSAPFALPATRGLPNEPTGDIAGVIALGHQIGLFWTNQLNQADYFAVHPDDAAPASGWTTEVAAAGNKSADDHFNMKLAADGRLWVAMKTSRTGSADILIGLLVRSPDGTWSPMYNVGSFGETWGTRGLVQIDELHRRVYVFYSPFHQAIYYKFTDMDRIALQPGLGIPFVVDPKVNDINNPTGTKQPVTPESGIVVVASSPGDLSYWHNTLQILP